GSASGEEGAAACPGVSALDAERPQQKGRQMPAVIAMADAGCRFRRAVWPHLVETGHRRGGAIAPGGMLAMPPAAALPLFALAVLARFPALAFRMLSFRTLLRGRVRLFAHPGDGLADQLLGRRDASAVGGRDDGDGGAAASGASGAADAMDVIVGMVRDVEVEDVADGGNVEAARGDVGGNQQRDFVPAELIERGHARRLVHVA